MQNQGGGMQNPMQGMPSGMGNQQSQMSGYSQMQIPPNGLNQIQQQFLNLAMGQTMAPQQQLPPMSGKLAATVQNQFQQIQKALNSMNQQNMNQQLGNMNQQMQAFSAIQAFSQIAPQMQAQLQRQMNYQYNQHQRQMTPQNQQKITNQQYNYLMSQQNQQKPRKSKKQTTKNQVPTQSQGNQLSQMQQYQQQFQQMQQQQIQQQMQQQQQQQMQQQMPQQNLQQSMVQPQMQQPIQQSQSQNIPQPIQQPISSQIPQQQIPSQIPQQMQQQIPQIQQPPPPPPPIQSVQNQAPIPPNIPSNLPNMNSAPESAFIRQLLKNLDKERTDFFFRLFNCKKMKRSKEERPDRFISTIFPGLKNIDQAIVYHLSVLVDNIRGQQDAFIKLSDPPVPPIFTKHRMIKPIYAHARYVASTGLEMQLPNIEKRGELRALGSFVFLGDPPPVNCMSVLIDKTEVKPCKFGTENFYFMVMPTGKSFFIQFPYPPPNFLTWFAVQFVEERPAIDVVRDLCAARNIAQTPSSAILAHTSKCTGCSFDAAWAVSELQRNGFAQCPSCRQEIQLADLELTVVQAGQCQPQSFQTVSEDEAALTLAKLTLADQVCALSPAAEETRGWNEMIFNGVGQPPGSFHQIGYSDTNEYINAVLSMN